MNITDYIIESFRLEKTFKIISPTVNITLPSPTKPGS